MGEAAQERGSDLLARISSEMVRAQKEYFGKGPVKAKSYMLDDFVLVVMRGGLTVAERTLVDAGRDDTVRDFRQVYEDEMAGRLTAMIESLTGRRVINYQSQIMFDPDIVLEFFLFAPDPANGEAESGETDGLAS